MQGDDQAQAFFYVEYAPLVARAVTRTLSTVVHGPNGAGAPLRSEVDDICGEIFARIFADRCRLLAQLRNPGAIHAWLITMTRNRTVDYVRKWGRGGIAEACEAREDQLPYAQDVHEAAVTNERDRMLRACLEELTPEDRLVLELFFIQGLKYTEIADLMGLNINTAAAKLRRAKHKLRKQLEDARYEYSA